MDKVKQTRNRDAARRQRAESAMHAELSSAVRPTGVAHEMFNLYETDAARAHSAILLARILGERHDSVLADLERGGSDNAAVHTRALLLLRDALYYSRDRLRDHVHHLVIEARDSMAALDVSSVSKNNDNTAVVNDNSATGMSTAAADPRATL